jgi:hypothetical protein
MNNHSCDLNRVLQIKITYMCAHCCANGRVHVPVGQHVIKAHIKGKFTCVVSCFRRNSNEIQARRGSLPRLSSGYYRSYRIRGNNEDISHYINRYVDNVHAPNHTAHTYTH